MVRTIQLTCTTLPSTLAALLLIDSRQDRPQENREAISERLELSFEQSRDGETYTPEQARQILAERRASRQ